MLQLICLNQLIIGKIYSIEIHKENYIIVHKGKFKEYTDSYIFFENVSCCYYLNKILNRIGPPLFMHIGNIKYNKYFTYVFYTMVKQAQQSMENRAIQIILRQLLDESFTY